MTRESDGRIVGVGGGRRADFRRPGVPHVLTWGKPVRQCFPRGKHRELHGVSVCIQKQTEYMRSTWFLHREKLTYDAAQSADDPYVNAWGNVRYPHGNRLAIQLFPMYFPSVSSCCYMGIT